MDDVDAPLEPIGRIANATDDIQFDNSKISIEDMENDLVIPNVAKTFNPKGYSSASIKIKSSNILNTSKRKFPASTSLHKLPDSIHAKKTRQNDQFKDKGLLESQLPKNISIQKVPKFNDHLALSRRNSKINPEKKLSKICLEENNFKNNPEELRAQEIHESQLRINSIQEEEARFKLEVEKTVGFYRVQEAKYKAIKCGYVPTKNDPRLLLPDGLNVPSAQ